MANDCKETFINKLKAHLGEGSIVEVLKCTDEMDVFVAGMPGTDKYVEELIAIIKDHDGRDISDEGIKYCQKTWTKIGSCFRAYYAEKEYSPISNPERQDYWLGYIGDNFDAN